MTAPRQRRARHLGEAIRLGDYDPGTEAWHKMRERRVGGSEIPAVLGLSEWQSAFSLWHVKANRLDPEAENPMMNFGKLIEPVIVELWSQQHPDLRVRQAGTYVHRERNYQLASPDRIVTGPDGPELLELKSDGDGWKWGEPGTDEVPPGYLAQCRWQLDTFGYRRCRVAVLVAGRPPVREYIVEADPDDAELMRKAGAEFVDTLEAGEVPDIDGHSATWQAIKELHPDIDGTDVEIDPAFAARYRHAVAEHKAAEEIKRLVSGELVVAMAGARRAVLPNLDNPNKPDVVARREPFRDGTRLVPVHTRQKAGAA